MKARDLLRLRGSHEAPRVHHAARRRGCRVACSVAENPVRFCLSVCRATICTISRDNVTKLLHSVFAVTFPRLLAGEECGKVFSVPAIAKLQRHDAGRARIAAIAS